MTPLSISKKLDAVLGAKLAAAEARTYKFDGGLAPNPDLGEVVLSFQENVDIYFSWEQCDDWHELSVRDVSHMLPDAFTGGTIEMEKSLAWIEGKLFTQYELFADQTHCLAVKLSFGSLIRVIAVGYESWNQEEQQAEFRNFSGDDLFLWSDERFAKLAKIHDLRSVVGSSYSVI